MNRPDLRGPVAIIDAVRLHPAPVRVNIQAFFQRWNRSLMAIAPLTNAARNTDGFELPTKIKPFGIDKLIRITNLTSKANGVASNGGSIRPGGFGNIARQTEITHAVGRFGKLTQKAAGRLKRLMHVPQGAGPAETRELKARRGMAFGDRACLVNPNKKEWHAFGTGTLQCGKSVPDLFD